MKYLCGITSSTTSEKLFTDASEYYDKRSTMMMSSNLENECIINSFIQGDGIDHFL